MTGMRIAHVLPSFHIGGQERVALDLARTQRTAGHSVTAWTIDAGPEGALGTLFRDAGVETRNVPKGRGVDPTLVLRLARRFARERLDVVHTHNPMAMTYGAPAARLAGAVVVHTKHGENLEPHARRVVVRRVIGRLTHAFVAVSPTTADAARRTRDVDERKLRVIPNGIDVGRFGADPRARAEARRELGIPEAAWVVGTVGRLAPEKNQVLLVRALAGALGERDRLLLVGDGPEAGAIAAAAAAAGVARWVHLPGARRDVPRMLAALDVFALPSVSEGLPLGVLEAMATGLPVVASAVGGLPDVVAEGETGFLFPSGDAAALAARLDVLRADPGLARRLGERARATARERHSLERMERAYMEIYERLLAARGRRPAAAPAPR